MTTNPAANLSGIDLENDWIVGKLITPHPNSTGGRFSFGYEVLNTKTNKKCFLKAIDLSSALASPDPMRALESLTTAYNFERDLLAKCKEKKLKRVLTTVADGNVIISSCPHSINQVYYLIFDMADGDIRKYKASLSNFDLAWCFRSMHHAAVGTQELHKIGIMHQDIKPSNILIFTEGSKLSDLGRSFDNKNAAPHDIFPIPGDRTYAPMELFYEHSFDNEMRKSIDLYTLGSLIFFHFCDISATQGILTVIKKKNVSLTGVFSHDLPFIQNAFGELLEDLAAAVKKHDTKNLEKIIELAKELCNPDPAYRGNPSIRAYKHMSKYDLQKYVSEFNLLAKKFELGI